MKITTFNKSDTSFKTENPDKLMIIIGSLIFEIDETENGSLRIQKHSMIDGFEKMGITTSRHNIIFIG